MASLKILEPNKEPRTIPIDATPLVIGRNKKCDLAFEFLGLSARHCQIDSAGETFKIVDLGSSNKTFVNTRQIAEHYLNNGDRITLTDIVLIFENDKQKMPVKSAANTPPPEPPPETQSDRPSDLTFVMGGAKLEKKMAEIRAGKAASDSGKANVSPASKTPAKMNARDYAAAMSDDPPPAGAGGKSGPRCWACIFLAIHLVADIALALAFYFHWIH